MTPAKIYTIYTGKCRGCGKIVTADIHPNNRELGYMARTYDLQIIKAESVTVEACECEKESQA